MSVDMADPSHLHFLEQSVDGVCQETISSRIDEIWKGYPCHSDSSHPTFEQAKQVDGHQQYGRLHPVRRPLQLMLYTLKLFKPFQEMQFQYS